jgi:hypothetical protein
MRRIDFNLFPETKKVEMSGGLISEELIEAMSEDVTLKSVVDLIQPGRRIYWVSDGNWSMHELLLEILNITGPAIVHISSYAMGETPARILAQLKSTAMIQKLFCVLDSRIDVRTAGSFQLIKAISDKCILIETHAKVTVIQNESWSLAVIGSANYTENKRYESGIITFSKSAVDMQLKWMKKELSDGN